jgi:hypothetical protein
MRQAVKTRRTLMGELFVNEQSEESHHLSNILSPIYNTSALNALLLIFAHMTFFIL